MRNAGRRRRPWPCSVARSARPAEPSPCRLPVRIDVRARRTTSLDAAHGGWAGGAGPGAGRGRLSRRHRWISGLPAPPVAVGQHADRPLFADDSQDRSASSTLVTRSTQRPRPASGCFIGVWSWRSFLCHIRAGHLVVRCFATSPSPFFGRNPILQAGRESDPGPGGTERRSSLPVRRDGQVGRGWAHIRRDARYELSDTGEGTRLRTLPVSLMCADAAARPLPGRLQPGSRAG